MLGLNLSLKDYLRENNLSFAEPEKVLMGIKEWDKLRKMPSIDECDLMVEIKALDSCGVHFGWNVRLSVNVKGSWEEVINYRVKEVKFEVDS